MLSSLHFEFVAECGQKHLSFICVFYINVQSGVPEISLTAQKYT